MLSLTIDVGWNRVVRRMLAAVGLPVVGLCRDAVGAIILSDLGVEEGADVQLDAAQIEQLWADVGGRELNLERQKTFHS